MATLTTEKGELKTRLDSSIDENKSGNYGAALGFEIGVGLAADWLVASPDPISRGLSFGIGYGANVIAQKIRGNEEFSHGEALAAGGFQAIPFGTTAKGWKGVRRAMGKGAAIGVGGEQVRTAIDEQRLLTPEEIAISGTIGAGLGGTIKLGTESADILIKQRRNNILKRKQRPSYTRPGSENMPIDRSDVFEADDLSYGRGPNKKTYTQTHPRTVYPDPKSIPDDPWIDNLKLKENMIDKINSQSDLAIDSTYPYSITSAYPTLPITSISNVPITSISRTNIQGSLFGSQGPIRQVRPATILSKGTLQKQTMWTQSRGLNNLDGYPVHAEIMDIVADMEDEVQRMAEVAGWGPGRVGNIRQFDPKRPLKHYKGNRIIKFRDRKNKFRELEVRWSTKKEGYVLYNRIKDVTYKNITQSNRLVWDKPSSGQVTGRSLIFKNRDEYRKAAKLKLEELATSNDPLDIEEYSKIVGSQGEGQWYVEHIHDRRAPVWIPVENKKGTTLYWIHKYKKNPDGSPLRPGDPGNLQLTGDRKFDRLKTALENKLHSESFINKYGEYYLELTKEGDLLIRNALDESRVTWRGTDRPAMIYKSETDIPKAFQRLEDIVTGKADDYPKGRPMSDDTAAAFTVFQQQLEDTDFPARMTDPIGERIVSLKDRRKYVNAQIEKWKERPGSYLTRLKNELFFIEDELKILGSS